MDLLEEYYVRRQINAPVVKYVPDHSHLILKSKDEEKTGWNWLHVNITWHPETHHPGYYHFQVAANPTIYASQDFQHCQFHHTKVVYEHTRLEWENYENVILNWSKEVKDYVAIPHEEAVFVSWRMFCKNYDSWLASRLTWRMVDTLKNTLVGSKEKRLEAIREVEDWIKEKYNQVHVCWKNIRGCYEYKNYADWLAKIVNNDNIAVYDDIAI